MRTDPVRGFVARTLTMAGRFRRAAAAADADDPYRQDCLRACREYVSEARYQRRRGFTYPLPGGACICDGQDARASGSVCPACDS